MTNDIDSLTDDEAKALLLGTALILHAHMRLDLDRLASGDFSDDDTDTMPARAITLQFCIAALANADQSPLEALADFVADGEDMLYWTCDLAMPLDDYMPQF